MMASMETLPLVYSLSGGMPPETLEVFWMHPDGLAEYVTGNPWPAQPPFNTIGHFRTTLTRQEQDGLSQLLREQASAQMGIPSLSADAGAEAFRAFVDGRVIEATWNPNSSPPVRLPLQGRVRQLIARTRDHPVSTLSAEWVADRSGQRPRLAFRNRGTEDFRLYDCEWAEEETRIQVRVRQAAAEKPEAPPSPNPIALLRLDPVRLANPTQWRPAPDGEIAVPPGETVHLEMSQGALSQAADAGGPAVLESLVRVSFWRPTPEGEPMLEQGWLMPPPLSLSSARP
jgi:hypothetical protein